jgi:hypothetical protein
MALLNIIQGMVENLVASGKWRQRNREEMGYKSLIRTESKPALCSRRILGSNIEKFREILRPRHSNEESGR